MSRQDANAAFARTSFLYGGNAAYVEQLQSRYEANPASVDAEWRAFFEGLKDDRADVIKGASGPSWQRPKSPARQRRIDCGADRRLERGREDRRRQDQGQGASQGRRDFGGRGAAGHAGFHPRADADPRLPRPRPLPRQARSARARTGEERGGARPALLRLHRGRSRPQDLPRQGARPRIRDLARDHRHPAPHLLPDARRRIPAHLRCRAEGLDPGAHRRPRQGDHTSPARASARSSTSSSRPTASRSSAT